MEGIRFGLAVYVYITVKEDIRAGQFFKWLKENACTRTNAL